LPRKQLPPLQQQQIQQQLITELQTKQQRKLLKATNPASTQALVPWLAFSVHRPWRRASSKLIDPHRLSFVGFTASRTPSFFFGFGDRVACSSAHPLRRIGGLLNERLGLACYYAPTYEGMPRQPRTSAFSASVWRSLDETTPATGGFKP